MDQVKAILYSVFGEQNTEFNTETGRVLIRMAPFEITNDNQKSHLITGLWIKFFLKVNGENVELYDFQGARSYQTTLEYAGRYRHSHLPAGTVENGFSIFCKGFGEFGAMCTMSRTGEVRLHDLDRLLMLMRYFLMYEDLDSPHIQISRIAPVIPATINLTISAQQLKALLESPLILELEFDNEYRMIDNRQNHSLLLEACPSLNKVLKIDGEYYSLNSQLTSQFNYTPIELFTFKGQAVMSEVGPADTTVVNTDEYYVNPFQFKYINDEFCREIKIRCLQKQNADSIQAKHAYDSFIRGLSGTKQIFMFKNT